MNRHQAKEILQSYRPGGGDAGDPAFAEALEMTKHDAELRRWFDEQQTFDRKIAGALQTKAPALYERKFLRADQAVRGGAARSVRWKWQPQRQSCSC